MIQIVNASISTCKINALILNTEYNVMPFKMLDLLPFLPISALNRLASFNPGKEENALLPSIDVYAQLLQQQKIPVFEVGDYLIICICLFIAHTHIYPAVRFSEAGMVHIMLHPSSVT